MEKSTTTPPRGSSGEEEEASLEQCSKDSVAKDSEAVIDNNKGSSMELERKCQKWPNGNNSDNDNDNDNVVVNKKESEPLRLHQKTCSSTPPKKSRQEKLQTQLRLYAQRKSKTTTRMTKREACRHVAAATASSCKTQCQCFATTDTSRRAPKRETPQEEKAADEQDEHEPNDGGGTSEQHPLVKELDATKLTLPRNTPALREQEKLDHVGTHGWTDTKNKTMSLAQEEEDNNNNNKKDKSSPQDWVHLPSKPECDSSWIRHEPFVLPLPKDSPRAATLIQKSEPPNAIGGDGGQEHQDTEIASKTGTGDGWWPETPPFLASAAASAATASAPPEFRNGDQDANTACEPASWQHSPSVSPSHVVIGIDVTEHMNCTYKDSKRSFHVIEGVVKVKNYSLVSVPFTLLLCDPLGHIETIQQNKRFADDVSPEWEWLDKKQSCNGILVESLDRKFRMNVPSSCWYLSVLRYKCSNATLRSVPIRIQSRVRCKGQQCQVLLQVSSNPHGDGVDLTDLTVAMEMSTQMTGLLFASPEASCRNGTTVVWNLSRLDWGEKKRFQARFRMREDDSSCCSSSSKRPSFPVSVAAECTHAKLSQFQIHVAEVSPANVTVKLSQQFRLTHREEKLEKYPDEEEKDDDDEWIRC